MKKILRRKKARKIAPLKARESLVGFMFTGLMHDIFWCFNVIAYVVGWPLRMVTLYLHREAKRYPELNILHNHNVIAISLGVVVLTLSFMLEHYSRSPVWQSTVELARASGVCPIWECISGLVKLGEDA
jgi:hypothetical protein